MGTNRTSAPTGVDSALVLVVTDGMQMPSRCLAQESHERVDIGSCDILDMGDASVAQLLRSGWAHTPQPFNRQRMQELKFTARFHDQEPIGFADGACDLGQELGRSTTHADGEADFGKDPSTEFCSDDLTRSHEPVKPGDVQECLVDRHGFDLGCGVVEDVKDGLACIGVCLHTWRNFDDVWAQLAGLASIHCGPDTHGPRFVTCRKHDTTANHHWAVSQGGVVSLLDRCIEGIKVGMQDRRHRTHVPTPTRCSSRFDPVTGGATCLGPEVENPKVTSPGVRNFSILSRTNGRRIGR